MSEAKNRLPVAASNTDDLRADLYILLAALLVRPPDARRLEQLAGLSAVPDTDAALGTALARLAQDAARSDAATVQREFEDLFIGLGRGEVVPYASWFDNQLLMAAPLARLRADLAALDIRRREAVREPEDHAAALCEIMALIIAEARTGFDGQAAFFSAHLAPWVFDFFRRIQQARSAAFYYGVGVLGECFMHRERQYLLVNGG